MYEFSNNSDQHYLRTSGFKVLPNINTTLRTIDTQRQNTTEEFYGFHLENDPSFTRYNVVVYGYFTPIVVLLSLITNVPVCLVLMKKHMRSATNVLLLAIAISDILTGIWPVPCFLHFYTFGNYKEWVPFAWCQIYHVFTDFLPTTFHTASTWLTVALAVQRYICIFHSAKATRICTVPLTFKTVLCINIVAFLSQLSRFLDTEYIPVEVPSVNHPATMMWACETKFKPFTKAYAYIYFPIYWWFRVIFINLWPCTCLVILNSLLIHKMKKARKKRIQLFRRESKSQSVDTNHTTTMLVIVVGVFLLVNIPLAVYTMMMIIQNHFAIQLLSQGTMNVASVIFNFAILLSNPFNFFTYCAMSSQFRSTFKGLFSANG